MRRVTAECRSGMLTVWLWVQSERQVHGSGWLRLLVMYRPVGRL